MSEDHTIVPATHALLRPGLALTDQLIDAAQMAVLRGEFSVAEFAEVHGAAAGAQLAREVGEAGRG